MSISSTGHPPATGGDDRGYGTDFAELGEDGKMKTIVVFDDPGPPPTRPA